MVKKVGVSLIKNVEHLGIYRIEPGERIFNRRNVGVLLMFGAAFISVTWFLIFGAKTIIEVEECFYLWVTVCCTTTGFFATILKTENLFELLDHANNFVEKRSQDPVRRVIYEKAIDLSEILIKLVNIWVLYMGLPSIILPLVTISYYLYFVAGMGADAFITFNAAKFPFDERTPIGYAVSTLILTFIVYDVLFVLAAALSLIILIFILAMAIAKDMKYKFLNFTLFSENQAKLVECIGEVYDVHSSCLELMNEINDVLELITTAAYLSCLLCISDALLMFIGAENGQDLLIRIILLIAAFNNIFIFCELGERISNAYEEAYTDCLQIDYHTFPLAVQKKMVLMLHGAQIQITLNGIGGIACSRDSFKNVCTSAYSYFSTFKEI